MTARVQVGVDVLLNNMSRQKIMVNKHNMVGFQPLPNQDEACLLHMQHATNNNFWSTNLMVLAQVAIGMIAKAIDLNVRP